MEVFLMTPTHIIGAALGIGTLIIGVYVWVAKHIANSKKHPCKDDIVFENVCAERGKANEAAHEFLKKWIEAAIIKSDKQHIELKSDMKAGFMEIKTLIKNNRR
jgi:hypothetical protein